MRNVRPHQRVGFVTSLQVCRFGSQRAPASARTARVGTHPRAVRRRCSFSPPSSLGLARAHQEVLLGSGVHGALGAIEGAFTFVPSSGAVAAPLWKAYASCCRRRPRLPSLRPLLATRHAWPLESRMAFTPATGTWPNPSFEATSSGKLRLPTAAPQLKR